MRCGRCGRRWGSALHRRWSSSIVKARLTPSSTHASCEAPPRRTDRRGEHRWLPHPRDCRSPRLEIYVYSGRMEVPLTPLEFMRRARRLYSDREAVVDGDRRATYGEFFSRCDRWSAALQRLGIGRGDRVAYIAPNTGPTLESFYAVPQIGAVL